MNKKYSLAQYQQYDDFRKVCKIGDIILTQTDKLMYQIGRNLLHVNFDHVSVVIEENSLIHISWPTIRKIHPLQLLSESTKYKVIRPDLNKEELNQFIRFLQTSLDATYDVGTFFQGASRKLLYSKIEFKNQEYDAQTNLKKERVCTNLVFYSLDASSQKFRELLQKNIKLLDFYLIGSFTPDDFIQLTQTTNYFTLIIEKQIEEPQGQNSIMYALKSISQQNLIEYLPYDKLINKIKEIKQIHDLYSLIQASIPIFQLYKLINMSKKQKVKRLVEFTVKKVSHSELKQKELNLIVNKIRLFVDIIDLVYQPISIKNGLKLLGYIFSLFTLIKQSNQGPKHSILPMISNLEFDKNRITFMQQALKLWMKSKL